MRQLIAVVLLAACHSHPAAGDDANGGDDGGGSAAFDAAIDAPNVRASVQVHVIDPTNANLGGNHVVFIDTDATVTDATTDGSGDASASVFPGASVTVVHPTTAGYEITTIQSIEPGDDLVVGTAVSNPASAGTFTLTWSEDNVAGVVGYKIYHPCGETDIGNKTTVSRTLASACVGGTQNGVVCTMGSQCPAGSCSPVMQTGCALSTMDVVIVAVDGALAPVAYAEQSGIAFTSGGSATITDTWHAIPSLAATYTDPTANVGGIELYAYVPDLRGSRSTASMTAAPTTSFALPRPNAAKATIQSILSTPDPGTDGAQQVLTQIVDGTATTYALDLGQSMLPWLTTPVLDTTAYTMTLTVDGTQPIDLFAAKAFYVRGGNSCVGGSNVGGVCTTAGTTGGMCPGGTCTAGVNYTWHVFSPTPGNVQLPTLPMTVGDIYPHPPFGTSSNPTYAYACQSDAINGYRPARQNVYGSLDTCTQTTDASVPRTPGNYNRLSRSN